MISCTTPALPDVSHYEQADSASLRNAVNEFSVFLPSEEVRVAVDVGSRDAKIALGLASFYKNADIYAFECNPDAISICRQNIANHPRVGLVEKAVADSDGTLTFYPIDPERTITPHQDGNIGASSLYAANPAYPHEQYVQNEVTVPCTTLSTWMRENHIGEIDILWMDLQGAELQALTGLGDTLGMVKIIHTEVQYREMYLGAPLFEEVNRFLQSRGFALVKQLYTSEWFGDVLYVRQDLLQASRKQMNAPARSGVPNTPASIGPFVQTKKSFVIDVKYGGLGDHLFFSHLPRIAKISGGYDRVLISRSSEFRHEDYRRLVWELNPYVDGFCDERRDLPVFETVEPGMNALDKLMLCSGLDDGLRYHEPEIYYTPRVDPKLADKTIYDPNFVSFVGNLDREAVQSFFDHARITVDYQMKLRDKSLPLRDVPYSLETKSLEEFCDIIASCERLYCLTSGTATLAAALGKSAIVLFEQSQKSMFQHSKRHHYVSLSSEFAVSPRPASPKMAVPPQAIAALQQGASPVPLTDIYGFNQSERDKWMIARAATVPAGARVLDVGAGTCPYRSLFAHCDYRTHDFMQYEGVKLGGTAQYGHIDYVSDVKSIPAPDGFFDVILCTEVLEHVPEPIEAMREMSRLLRPGGRLLVSAPLGSGLHQLPYHYYGGYTPGWYQQFGTAFGLDVQEILPNGGFFKHLAQECARVAWTLPEHQHLHGANAAAIQQLFGELLPRYLFALDERHPVPQFTVGYHVEAVKSRDAALVQSLIDQDCGSVPLYAEAALACLAASDPAAAYRYYEDACEIDADHPSLANLHFYHQTMGTKK